MDTCYRICHTFDGTVLKFPSPLILQVESTLYWPQRSLSPVCLNVWPWQQLFNQTKKTIKNMQHIFFQKITPKFVCLPLLSLLVLPLYGPSENDICVYEIFNRAIKNLKTSIKWCYRKGRHHDKKYAANLRCTFCQKWVLNCIHLSKFVLIYSIDIN